jgi:hypothetical protein
MPPDHPGTGGIDRLGHLDAIRAMFLEVIGVGSGIECRMAGIDLVFAPEFREQPGVRTHKFARRTLRSSFLHHGDKATAFV